MVWLLTLALIALQSLLSPLLTPYPPADLFSLAALTFMGRFRLPAVLLVAYALGLVQDAVGSGQLGLHALGLAAGVFGGSLAAPRTAFLHAGLARKAIVLCLAWSCKWLTFTLLLTYLGHAQPAAVLGQSAGLELALTLTVTALLHPLFLTLPRRRERFYL